jgi:hypothetical protein
VKPFHPSLEATMQAINTCEGENIISHFYTVSSRWNCPMRSL